MAKSRSPLDRAVQAELARPLYAKVLLEWEKAVDRLEADSAGAITAARSLLESICKLILDSTGVAYSTATDLPKLYSLVSKQLGMSASDQTEQLFRSFFGATHTIVQSIGELRNKIGDAHGKGKSSFVASRAQAEMAVNLAGSVAAFLVATFEGYLAANRRLDTRGRAILRFDKALVWRLCDHCRNSPKWQKSWGVRKAKPSLWLVGDAGVYLMSNGNPQISHDGKVPKGKAKTQTPYLSAPAEGCNPIYDEADAWWPIHNAISGGDDFVIPIPLEDIEEPLKSSSSTIVIIADENGYEVLSDAAFDKAN